MLKRFDARLWTMGALVPMILAGCATTSPATAPAAQPAPAVKASYATQGGAQGYGAPGSLQAAPNPCGECPPSIPAAGYGLTPFAALNLEQLTARPFLDYSWYYARGNFTDFGWAPGFYAQLANFMWYPTASGYWPYAYNAAASCYTPYSMAYGGAPIYPYLGLGGGMAGAYAGLEHRTDGGMGQGYGQGQGMGQGYGQGQGMDQGYGQGQGMDQGQSQGGGY